MGSFSAMLLTLWEARQLPRLSWLCYSPGWPGVLLVASSEPRLSFPPVFVVSHSTSSMVHFPAYWLPTQIQLLHYIPGSVCLSLYNLLVLAGETPCLYYQSRVTSLDRFPLFSECTLQFVFSLCPQGFPQQLWQVTVLLWTSCALCIRVLRCFLGTQGFSPPRMCLLKLWGCLWQTTVHTQLMCPWVKGVPEQCCGEESDFLWRPGQVLTNQ